MRNTWTVFAATLLLVFALAACGGDSQNGNNGDTGANNGVGDTNTGNTNGGTDDSANGGLIGGQDDASAGVNGSTNGQNGTNNGVTGSNNGQMPDSQTGTNGTSNNNGTTNGQNTNGQNGTGNGDSLIDDARDALDDVGDALTGGNVTKQSHSGSLIRGASFDQMVRNGRVHDTDGNLNDMENSVTPGVMF